MSSIVQSAPVAETAPDARRRRRRRYILLSSAFLLAAAILVPPSISMRRFQPRVAGALSRALGREVSIGEVQMRLLPAPGLLLTRVVVNDDPAFSSEPMLRSDEVTAWLRISSLWRGRLEIARLSFDSPSFNLVRRPDGHWNLESLLERARQTPVAPTAKRTSGAQTRFPYIEFNSGRVNLKLGVEKTVYSLSDADFALWLEKENEWHLRLNAQPIRTDANLQDTGTVSLSGTIQRGNSLSDTPLDLHFVLDRGQLGQLSTLVYGRDRGWRGTTNISAELKGTPAALDIHTSASVDGFDRYDIPSAENVTLRTSCTAEFHSTSQQIDGIRCTSPVGDGVIDARGTMAGLLPVRSYAFSVVARDLPASAISSLIRRMKKDLPEDVSASGTMTAQASVQQDAGATPQWSGNGSFTGLMLRSSRMDGALALGNVRFALASDVIPAPHRKRGPSAAAPEIVVVQPFPVELGGDTPVQVEANFSRTAYSISVHGDAGLKRLLQVSEALGVATPRFSPDGDAIVNLSVAGEWAGFAQPLVLGSARVKGTVPVNGIGTPVQLTSATLSLEPNGIQVDHLAFGWPKSNVLLTGSMQLPRRCTTIETCPLKFRLHADTLSIESLNALLNPEAQNRPWYAFIESSAARNPVLARITASGTLDVTHLLAGNANFSNFSSNAALSSGVLTLNGASAVAWDGKLNGSLRADFGASPAQFEASGTLAGASVSETEGKAHPAGGTGKLNGNFVLSAAGLSTAALQASATGKFGFDWRNPSHALALDGPDGLLRIRQFHGTANLRDRKLYFSDGRLTTDSGIYQVSGTAALDHQLSVTLFRGDAHAYEITGTLEKPKVSPAAPAQAKLNP